MTYPPTGVSSDVTPVSEVSFKFTFVHTPDMDRCKLPTIITRPDIHAKGIGHG
jgi:hypothetical protein